MSTAPIPQPRSATRAGGAPHLLGREPRGDEVVERPAVAVQALEDPPITREIAEVLARARCRATGRPRAGRGPARRTARRADDAGGASSGEVQSVPFRAALYHGGPPVRDPAGALRRPEHGAA